MSKTDGLAGWTADGLSVAFTHDAGAIQLAVSRYRPLNPGPRVWELFTSKIRLVTADPFDIRSGIHGEGDRQH
jgi:hypothetical protein